MSDIEEAIESVLVNDTAVRNLVASSAGMRIFAMKLVQGAVLPAVTYQLISDPSINSHDGPSGLAKARIQFDAYAANKEQARAVTRAVRLAFIPIHRYVMGVFLTGARKINESSMFDPDPRLRRRSMDMEIWHSEEQTA